MAIFRVEHTVIDAIWDHPNADRLELAKVEGIDLQFVIGKDIYSVGMPVIYFPIDSILPQPLIDHLELGGRLSGKAQNRVKTMKLRKQMSQGFVCPVRVIREYLGDVYFGDGDNERLTDALGVTKYIPKEIACHAGTLVPRPEGVGLYDIEGVERYGEVLDDLLNVPCMVTEKIEGTNWALTIDASNKIHVCQRNHAIREDVPPTKDNHNTYWKAARTGKLIELVQEIKQNAGASQVTLRGEMIGPGIQGNYYGVDDHMVLIFDVLIDDRYVWACNIDKYIPVDIHVPILANNITLRDWLDGRTITEASTGKSNITNRLREGIVIRPSAECFDDQGLGRIILKKRSPEYLEKTGN